MDELLNQTCKIYTGVGTPDKYGKVTFSSYNDTNCRFVSTFKHFKDSKGSEVSINGQFQLANQNVNVGTKIDFESKSYLVVGVEDWRGFDGELFGCNVLCSNYPI